MKREDNIEKLTKFICNACDMEDVLTGNCTCGKTPEKCYTSTSTARAIYNANYIHVSEFLQMVENVCKYENTLSYEIIKKGILRQMEREHKYEKKM